MKAYNLAIQEKYTPQEAKKLLLDNITVFKKTQIYAYLPPECKNPVKQKAGSVSHKLGVSVPKSEQNTVTEQSDSINGSVSPADEADSYLVESPTILILGGGFAGVEVLRRLQNRFQNDVSIDIIMISKDNFFFFFFTSMLHEVASGMIETRHTVTPIRAFCNRSKFYAARVESTLI